MTDFNHNKRIDIDGFPAANALHDTHNSKNTLNTKNKLNNQQSQQQLVTGEVQDRLDTRLDKVLQEQTRNIGSHSKIYTKQIKVNELRKINQKLKNENDKSKTEYDEIVSRREEMTRKAQSCFEDNMSALESVFPKQRQNESIENAEEVVVPPKIKVQPFLEWTAAKQELPSYQSSGAAKHKIQQSYQEFVVPKFSPSNPQHVLGKSEVPFVNFANVAEIQEVNEVTEVKPVNFPLSAEPMIVESNTVPESAREVSIKQIISPISLSGPFMIPDSARYGQAMRRSEDFIKIQPYNIPTSSRDGQDEQKKAITPCGEQATPVLPTEEDLLDTMRVDLQAARGDKVPPFLTIDNTRKLTDQSGDFFTPLEIRGRSQSRYLKTLTKDVASPSAVGAPIAQNNDSPNLFSGQNQTVFATNPLPRSYQQINSGYLNKMPPIEKKNSLNSDPQNKVYNFVTPASDKQDYQISSISPIHDQPECPATPILIPTENSPTTKWTPYQPTSAKTNDKATRVFKSPVNIQRIPGDEWSRTKLSKLN